MKQILHKLTWKDEHERIHPLAHVFFLITLVFGIGFALMGDWSGVTQTVLYTQTTAAFGTNVVSVWGWAALAVTAANTLMIATRKKTFAYAATFGGYALWLYAAIIYLSTGFYFQFAAAALPNLLFWTWYYFAVKDHARREHGQSS